MTIIRTTLLSFISVSLFVLSGAVFAKTTDQFLPQCHTKSEKPFFQPNPSAPFYLARQDGNHGIQYCNKEGLMTSNPWVNDSGNSATPEFNKTASVLKFSIDPKTLSLPNPKMYQFSTCKVSFSGKSWQIGSCQSISDSEGNTLLNAAG